MIKFLSLWFTLISCTCWSQTSKYILPKQYNRLSILYPYNGHYHTPAYSYDTLKDGIWVQFFESDPSKPALAWSINNGKQEGAEYFVSLTGLIERVNHYDKGVLVGGLHYYDNGIKKDSIRYSPDYENKYLMSWYFNGKIRNVVKHDLQEYWYESGQKKFEKRFNTKGQLNGEILYWDEEGQIKYRGQWADGEPKESYFRRSKNGKLLRMDFKKIPKRYRFQIVSNALMKTLN